MSYPPPPQHGYGDAGDYQSQQPGGMPSYSPHQPQYPSQQPMGVGPGPTAPSPTGAMPHGTLPPPVAPRKSPAVPILAVALVASVIAAGLFLVMWLQADGDLAASEDVAADRQSTIGDLEGQVEESEARIAELEGVEAELETARSDSEEMQDCLESLEAYWETEVDTDEETEAFSDFIVACDSWLP